MTPAVSPKTSEPSSIDSRQHHLLGVKRPASALSDIFEHQSKKAAYEFGDTPTASEPDDEYTELHEPISNTQTLASERDGSHDDEGKQRSAMEPLSKQYIEQDKNGIVDLGPETEEPPRQDAGKKAYLCRETQDERMAAPTSIEGTKGRPETADHPRTQSYFEADLQLLPELESLWHLWSDANAPLVPHSTSVIYPIRSTLTC